MLIFNALLKSRKLWFTDIYSNWGTLYEALQYTVLLLKWQTLTTPTQNRSIKHKSLQCTFYNKKLRRMCNTILVIVNVQQETSLIFMLLPRYCITVITCGLFWRTVVTVIWKQNKRITKEKFLCIIEWNEFHFKFTSVSSSIYTFGKHIFRFFGYILGTFFVSVISKSRSNNQ